MSEKSTKDGSGLNISVAKPTRKQISDRAADVSYDGKQFIKDKAILNKIHSATGREIAIADLDLALNENRNKKRGRKQKVKPSDFGAADSSFLSDNTIATQNCMQRKWIDFKESLKIPSNQKISIKTIEAYAKYIFAAEYCSVITYVRNAWQYELFRENLANDDSNIKTRYKVLRQRIFNHSTKNPPQQAPVLRWSALKQLKDKDLGMLIFSLNAGLRADSLFSLERKDISETNDCIEIIIRRDKMTGSAPRTLKLPCGCTKEYGKILCPLHNTYARNCVPLDASHVHGLLQNMQLSLHTFRRTAMTWIAKIGNILKCYDSRRSLIRKRFNWRNNSAMDLHYSADHATYALKDLPPAISLARSIYSRDLVGKNILDENGINVA